MHTLTLTPSLKPYSRETQPSLCVEVWIDDQLLVNYAEPGLGIDLVALAESLAEEGEHFIITCACGDAGCAGITEGVQVWRTAGQVHWQVRQWGKRAKPPEEFVFAAAAYGQAIRQGLRQFMQLYATHAQLETTPYMLKDALETAQANGQLARWLVSAHL